MRVIRYIILILAILFGWNTAEAQTFTGTLVDKDGKAVSKASVVLKGEKNNVITFTRSNDNGKFSISIPEGKTATNMEINHTTYDKKIIPLKEYKNGQQTTLEEKTVALKEVKVTPKWMRKEGDTLTYTVAGFKQKQDRSIEDVIRRLPGIEVNASGQISYQGKNINKFYVENMDLMGHKYAQVSRNLQADKVASVQVYENHQPVKMQRGVSFSEQAALNLVLKEDAKNVWTGVVDAGIGATLQRKTKWLRDARWVEMIFGRKKQSLNMYKTNNTGKDISSEVRGYGQANDRSLIDNIIRGGEQRSTFNDTHIAASNWLLKTGKEANLRFQVSGLLDKITQEQYSEKRYNDVDSQLVIIEDIHQTGRRNELNAEMKYEMNGSTAFLNNVLSGYMDFNKGYGNSFLNNRLVNTEVKPRRRSISNHLNGQVRIKGNNFVMINANASYSYIPGTMLLYNNDRETLDMEVMHLTGTATYMKALSHWSLMMQGGIQNDVEMMDVAYADTAAHDRYSFHRIYIQPQLSRAFSRLRLNLFAKMGLLKRSIADRHDEKWTIEPNVNLVYDLTGTMKISTGYGYHYIASGSLGSLTHVPFYINYNNLRRGTGYFTSTDNHIANAGWSYQGTANSMMASINFSATFHEEDIYRSNIKDGMYSREKTGMTQHTSNYSLNANIGKRFLWWMANIKFNSSYSWRNYQVLSGDALIPLQNQSANVSLNMSVSPVMIFSAELSSAVNYTRRENRNMTDAHDSQSYLNYRHALKLFFFPGMWQIGWNTECTHSNDKSMSFNLFSDVSVLYRSKTYDIGIYLNNIFGNSERRNRYVDMTGEFYTVSYLRPREIMAKVSFNF